MRASISVKMFLYDNFNDISESAGVLTLSLIIAITPHHTLFPMSILIFNNINYNINSNILTVYEASSYWSERKLN